MDVPELDRRRGGITTVIGYVVVLAILFREPSRGLAATGTPQGVLYFVAFPLAGLASGVYAVRRGPYSGVGLFLAGTYLAIVGLTLGFGLVSASGTLAIVGLGLFVLALVAVVASLRAMWAYFRPDVPASE